MANPPITAQELLEFRQRAAVFAAVFEGCHYLWGTAGNTFSKAADGSLKANGDGYTSIKRRTALPLAQAAALPQGAPAASAMKCWGIDAAFSATGGQHVCAGRFQTVPLGRVATYSTNAATEKPLLDAFLKYRASGKSFMEYVITWMIANNLSISPSNPGPQPYFFTLTPRMGFATVDAVSTVHGKLIWGESCVDRRHFDCVGLINGAWAWALGWPDITLEIFQWAHVSVTTQMAEGTPVMAGDILCVHKGTPTQADRSIPFPWKAGDAEQGKWHHIGICVDDKGTVAQAEQGPVGVTLKRNLIGADGKFLQSGFNFRGRVSDAVLRQWKARAPKT